jgi:hypothetical protein
MENEGSFGWANAALLLLVGATLAFLACLQCSFWAKLYVSTPAEIEMWWGAEAEAARERMHGEQHADMAAHRRWANRVRRSYNAGLLAFLLGLTACLIPAGGLADASGGRQAVVVLAALGLVLEVAWMVRTRFGG